MERERERGRERDRGGGSRGVNVEGRGGEWEKGRERVCVERERLEAIKNKGKSGEKLKSL